MRSTRALGWTVLAVLSTLGPGLASAAAPAVIRVGNAGVGVGNRQFVGGSSFAPVHVQRLLEEEFEKDGIQVEYTFFKGAGPAVNEAVAGGLVDVWTMGDLPAIVGRAGGLRTRVLLAIGSRGNVYAAVPADSPARRLEDLAGKRIALFKGTIFQLAASRFLPAHGLSERDVRAINMETGAGKAALVSKDVDALLGGTDLLSLRDRGIARIVYSTRDESPAFLTQSALLAREEFVEKHPELVQRIVNVWVRAARWASLEENRDALFRLWARSGTPYEAWKDDYAGTALALRQSPLLDDYVAGRYRAAVEDARRLGFIRRTFDVEAWFDRRFLERAVDAAGLRGFWPEHDTAGVRRPKTDKS